MKTPKTIIVMLLCINASFIFSQVTVKYKYNGVYKEVEYKSYEDCGCNTWAVDFFKKGADKNWGMSTNSDKTKLEAEIKEKINADYNIWHRTTSDHENYIIYCFDRKFGHNYKEVETNKVTSADGGIMVDGKDQSDQNLNKNPDNSSDIAHKKALTEMLGRTKLNVNSKEKKWHPKHLGPTDGSRGEVVTPKVESMSIEVEQAPQTTTKKK